MSINLTLRVHYWHNKRILHQWTPHVWNKSTRMT